MKNNVYVDIHVLQTLPPSCVNRDDTGRPKTAEYGGVQRAVVSSQAWKHAIRKKFSNDELMPQGTGLRTKLIKKLIIDEIMKLDPTVVDIDTETEHALVLVEILKEKTKKGKKNQSNAENDEKENDQDVLFFISPGEIELFAKTIIKHIKQKNMSKIDNDNIEKDNKKEGKEQNKEEKEYKDELVQALKSKITPDIQLFGRMFASNTELNVDAASQVAFAISTHKVKVEIDFFSAVDDVKEGSGAGHIDTKEYDSAVFYRYSNLNVNKLSETYGDQTCDIIRNYIEAFVLSMPTGMINSHGNRTVPAYVYVAVRTDQPIYLGEAFEKPVVNQGDGFMIPSKQILKSYAKDLYSIYGNPAGEYYSEIGNQDGLTLEQLLIKTKSRVGELLA